MVSMTITEEKVTVTEAEPRKRGRPPKTADAKWLADVKPLKPLDPKFLAEVDAL